MAIQETSRGDSFGNITQNYLYDWARRTGNLANMAIVSTLSAVSDGCIVIGYPTSSTGETSGLMDQYKTQLMMVAHDYGWSLFDSRAVFGRSNATAQAKGLRFDANHPNGAGHTAYGSAYYTFLSSLGF